MRPADQPIELAHIGHVGYREADYLAATVNITARMASVAPSSTHDRPRLAPALHPAELYRMCLTLSTQGDSLKWCCITLHLEV